MMREKGSKWLKIMGSQKLENNYQTTLLLKMSWILYLRRYLKSTM
uniref:FAD6 n=1 Tax=Arundo donax TaxID=35708 RepID=A0A0A9GU00_ARUDO